jgi:hypothetical protein
VEVVGEDASLADQLISAVRREVVGTVGEQLGDGCDLGGVLVDM